MTDHRYPWLYEAAQKNLNRILEHANAPRFNHECGDCLDDEDYRACIQFEHQLRSTPVGWRKGETPAWLNNFADQSKASVPIYRQKAALTRDFSEFPTTNRQEMASAPWSFVPDDQSLDKLMVYFTSGSTGKHMDVLSHPVVSNKFLVLMRHVLRKQGIELDAGPDQMAMALVCAQSSTYTYASVSRYLKGSAFVKLNLNPKEWRQPQDMGAFLNDVQPQIISGDPISLAELARLDLKLLPRALISTAMTLSPALCQQLSERFLCPVIDVYSMNESRLMAVADDKGLRWVAPDCFVEIFAEHDEPVQHGEWGEITITSNRNPLSPLIRYRTGDFGRLSFADSVVRIIDFQGRPPVVFRVGQRVINNIEIAVGLRAFPLLEYGLHQQQDGGFVLKVRAEASAIKDASTCLQSMGISPLKIEPLLDLPNKKLIQFSTDLKQKNVALSYDPLAPP